MVDELAHTNVPGVSHQKRWEDVMQLLDEGINVISAFNVQHLESLNDVVAKTLGITVRETVPDWVLAVADQVINLDIGRGFATAFDRGQDLSAEKVQAALANFFTEENLTTLRELALREVANSVDRVREEIVRREEGGPGAGKTAAKTVDRVLVALASNPPYTAILLRKASRIAGRLNTDWFCVYVQTPEESAARIDSSVQRRLVENIQLAQSMGADVVKLVGTNIADEIKRFARERGVTLLLVGQSRRPWWHRWRYGSVVQRLTHNTEDLDVLVRRPADARSEVRSGRFGDGGRAG